MFQQNNDCMEIIYFSSTIVMIIDAAWNWTINDRVQMTKWNDKYLISSTFLNSEMFDFQVKQIMLIVEFPTQKTSNTEMFSFDDVIMSR